MANAIAEPPPPTTPPAPAPQPAAPATPAPEPAPQPAPTPEPAPSLTDTLKDKAFWDSFPHGYKEKPKKKDEPASDPNAPATPAKPTEPPPTASPGAAAPAAPEPKKPRAVKKTAPIDPERLVAVATEAATRASLEARAAQPAPGAAPAAVDVNALIATLPEDLQADADVYLEMQRLHPEKYGSLVQTLADYSRKEDDYSKKWQREHPDDEFDPDDPKHDAFYDDNKPKFSKKEFKEAERSLIRRQAREEIKAELQPQLDQFEMQRRGEAVVPEVLKSSQAVLRSALVGINKDYDKYADKPQELIELAKSDPVATDTIVTLLNEWHPVVEEVVKIYSGAAKFDNTNGIHMRIFAISNYYDDDRSKRPLAERTDAKGRLFATREQYYYLSPAEKEKRWYLDKDKMLEIITQAAHEDAAKIYAGEQERLERFAKARGFKTDASASPANGAPPANGVTPAPAAPPEPPIVATPTVTGKTTLSPDRPGHGSAPMSWRDRFGTGITYK